MKFIKTLVLISVIGGVVFFFRADIQKFLKRLPELEQKAETIIGTQLKQQTFLPEPLRALVEKPATILTKAGVIQETNKRRALAGLPALTENTKLDTSAGVKVRDMFQKQYFAHVSPSGVSISDLADNAGYRYIIIGENLALGNFGDDAGVVEAWMNSPGHRANILNTKYTEIGVSVLKGTFEGRTTWLAVQHFGKALSECPAVDASLKKDIDTTQAQLTELNNALLTKKAEIDEYEPKRGAEYNQKVNEYNELVHQYNVLLSNLKDKIELYNKEVKAFNACAQS